MVFSIAIPNFDNLDDELLRKVRDGIADLADWNMRDTPTGAMEAFSSHVNSVKRDGIVSKLMELKVQYTVEDVSGQYVHVATVAPEAYDYPWTIPLGSTSINEFGKTERHVAVQKERQEYQFGRYRSGLQTYRVIT